MFGLSKLEKEIKAQRQRVRAEFRALAIMVEKANANYRSLVLYEMAFAEELFFKKHPDIQKFHSSPRAIKQECLDSFLRLESDMEAKSEVKALGFHLFNMLIAALVANDAEYATEFSETIDYLRTFNAAT